MKKIALSTAVLCTAIATALPALALNQQSSVEAFTCQGPARIIFDNQSFEKTAVNETLCAAQYSPTLPTSAQAAPWLSKATFQTQWITQPQEDVLHALQSFIPQRGALKGYNHQNPDDMTSLYQAVEREEKADTLNYIVLRGVRQSDNSVRVYQFRVTLTAAPKPAHGYDEENKGPYEEAYDSFEHLVKTYQNRWFNQIQNIQIED